MSLPLPVTALGGPAGTTVPQTAGPGDTRSARIPEPAGPGDTRSARIPEPASEGSPSAKQAYTAARGFEQMLVEQLSQSMVASSGLEGEESGGVSEEGSGEAATGGAGPVSSLLVQALSEGLTHGGGLGLAGQLGEAASRQASQLGEAAARQAGSGAQPPGGGTAA